MAAMMAEAIGAWAEEFPWVEAVMAFTAVMSLFEVYLSVRQHRALSIPELPSQLASIVSKETFLKARAYQLDKSNFGFVKGSIMIVLELVTLWLRSMAWFWQAARLSVGSFAPTLASNEYFTTAGFIALFMIYEQVISLPFAVYSTFVIEQVHGFNKTSSRTFVLDIIKGFILSLTLAVPFTAGFVYIVRLGLPYLPLQLWLFTVTITLFLTFIYPTVIAPLFNKFTPLPDSDLRTKIEDLARSLQFPLKRLYVMDGSTRSAHSNAYFYGFFNNKRIVIYDTLIAQTKNEEEVVATLAHELGHWKRSHTLKQFFLMQPQFILWFGGYSLVRRCPALFRSFGFNEEPVIVGLILLQLVASPISHVMDFVGNIITRIFEYQADHFAVSLGYATPLREGLINMQEKNLSPVNNDPWYSAYHYSHPVLPERLAAIEAEEKKGK